MPNGPSLPLPNQHTSGPKWPTNSILFRDPFRPPLPPSEQVVRWLWGSYLTPKRNADIGCIARVWDWWSRNASAYGIGMDGWSGTWNATPRNQHSLMQFQDGNLMSVARPSSPGDEQP
ncbi:hypothetical protein N7519_005871 [Penicillium mononematosum]|uniref:uncharacterized protein n=1 Tax=Penicillium mononematosum TaxID=268346 RepID=UPI0025486A99|nr:uncharacterized protein N7519_005871 [Penicillium mononematosum]KAJ6184570.1 hypothetical protein N7519_005871 [Penicillium mononematosum]